VDDLDKTILAQLQRDIPLCERPFAILAERLDATEQDVIQRVSSLRQSGVIRDISAIFHPPALGYRQALVAFGAGANPDAAGQIVAAHPGVSHCYARTHERYSLWFTVAVSGNSALGLEPTVARLAELAGVECYHLLPTIETLKLAVRFDFSADTPQHASDAPPPNDAPPIELNDELIQAVGLLQRDLPATAAPFDALCATHPTLTTDRLLTIANDLRDRGVMRRYAAVFHHRRTGAGHNVMAVWQTPSPQVAARAAEHPAVSHCYRRVSYPDWPYDLYTMVHARDEQQAQTVLAELRERICPLDECFLESATEYKKSRVRYCSTDEALWESQNS
jgi:siroheme decarboxylase